MRASLGIMYVDSYLFEIPRNFMYFWYKLLNTCTISAIKLIQSCYHIKFYFFKIIRSFAGVDETCLDAHEPCTGKGNNDTSLSKCKEKIICTFFFVYLTCHAFYAIRQILVYDKNKSWNFTRRWKFWYIAIHQNCVFIPWLT